MCFDCGCFTRCLLVDDYNKSGHRSACSICNVGNSLFGRIRNEIINLD
jgi:hypothetical protein